VTSTFRFPMKSPPQGLSSSSCSRVWWAKVEEFGPLHVPKMVELGFFHILN
jgi:hypothetical protein